MEYLIDIDIIGEIFIPLENNLEKFNNTSKNLDTLFEKSFNDFRSIVFQGEVLRLFVALKIDSPNKINTLLEEMFFKLEFDPSCDIDEIDELKGDDIENDLGFPNADNNELFGDYEKPKCTDLFAIHRNTIFTSKENSKDMENIHCRKENTSFIYKNLNYEFVSRKHFLEDKKIAIFEIIKHISKFF